MHRALDRWSDQLTELGVTVDVEAIEPGKQDLDRATVKLAHGTSEQTYRLLYGPEINLAIAARSEADVPTLVFTTFASPRTTEGFRRLGVQYLDTAGNAWVRFGDVLIDVRGRPRPERTTRPARLSGNLFSTGRAQVTFALIAWPRLWDAPQRDLARAAGVSLGQAHNTLRLLAEAGYEGERPRRGQTELLDLWAAAFPTGLSQRLTIARYRGDVEQFKTSQSKDVVWLSGEQAVTDVLRPTSMTLYVRELDPRLAVVNRWRSDGESNIVVRRKFWNAPEDGSAPQAGVHRAPWPLVYADLLASDDARVRGVAKEWKDRNAGLERDS